MVQRWVSRRIGLLLLAALSWELVSAVRRGHRDTDDPSSFGPACKSYLHKTCGLLHKSSLPTDPYCHSGNATQIACKFDTTSLFSCPLPLEGVFVDKAISTHQCKLDEKAERRVFSQPVVLPVCGVSCCSGQLEGSFKYQKSRKLHSTLQFQPNISTCEYHQYSWREAMSCLEGSKLVIAGDSVMRQFFNMAITMFRGQEVALDYNKHAHGRYRVCKQGDKLEFGSFEPSRWEIPLHEVGQLFGSSEDPVICEGNPVFEIDYLWAPRFIDLVPQLKEYHSVIGHNSSSGINYVTFAGFWEDRTEVSQDYLNQLDVIRKSANSLVMLGVPTTRIYGEKGENGKMRNEKMRQWAATRRKEDGENVHFVDFDYLAHASNAPPGVGSLNWHYQCFLDHLHIDEVANAAGGLDNSWYWPEAPEHIYPSVWTEEGGTCPDDMDRNLWQIVFNLLCNSRDKDSIEL